MAKPKSLKAVNQTKAQSKPPKSKKNQEPATAASDFDESVVIRKLADSERSVREKALKALAKFISTKRPIDSFKLQKLWKGLFFTVWHSDRPLTQQALVQELADLSTVVRENNYWKFIDAFWLIMSREWHTIDKHRIDKFYMLIRRVFAANLTKIAENNWADFWVKSLQELLMKYSLNPTDAKIPHALRLHMCDILLDEIDRLEDDSVPIAEILAPVLNFVEKTTFKTVKLYAIENIFRDARLVEKYDYTSRFTPVQKVEVEESDSADDFDKTSDEESESEDEVEGEDDEEEFTGFD